MATRFNIERKSIENIYKSLACYNCHEVPGPIEEQRNRYTCVVNSHLLCEKCKSQCNCGSWVGYRSISSIDAILKDLAMCCPNYNRGCREIFVQAEDLENHRQYCIFRKVFCPDTYTCEKREKIVFKVSMLFWFTFPRFFQGNYQLLIKFIEVHKEARGHRELSGHLLSYLYCIKYTLYY